MNISLDRAVDYLTSQGHEVEARPTTKISDEVYQVLLDEFQTDKSKKVASKEVGEEKRKEKEALRIQMEREQEERRLAREKRDANKVIKAKAELSGPKTVGKIDLDKKPEEEEVQEAPKVEEPTAPAVEKEEVVEVEAAENTAVEAKQEPTEEVKEPEAIQTQYKKLSGPKITGDKIDLSKFEKPKKKKKEETKTAEAGSKEDSSDRRKAKETYR